MPLKRILIITSKIVLVVLAIGIFVIAVQIWFSIKPNQSKISMCSVATDCVLVKTGYCGGAVAINNEFIDRWNGYLKKQDVLHSFPWGKVICKITLPLNYFEAVCRNNSCTAVQKEDLGN